jgi:hypothetical protein
LIHKILPGEYIQVRGRHVMLLAVEKWQGADVI